MVLGKMVDAANERTQRCHPKTEYSKELGTTVQTEVREGSPGGELQVSGQGP